MFRVVKDKAFIKVIRSPKVQTFIYKHRFNLKSPNLTNNGEGW